MVCGKGKERNLSGWITVLDSWRRRQRQKAEESGCLYPAVMDMEKLKGREVQKHAFSGAAQICKKKTENTLSSEETGLCSPDEQAGELSLIHI